jgi:hypothetical protein
MKKTHTKKKNIYPNHSISNSNSEYSISPIKKIVCNSIDDLILVIDDLILVKTKQVEGELRRRRRRIFIGTRWVIRLTKCTTEI